MKHNWEYKPFNDVAATISPTCKVEKSDYEATGLFPIVSQEDFYISGYWNNPNDLTHHVKPVIIFGDHSRVLKYVDFDFVVGADGVKIIMPKDGVNPKFLFYYLNWYKIPSLGYSRHFKLIKKALFPIPSLDCQNQIICELDLVSNIIEDCRELLRNLDALAQSLFYDYFGDPIANPKGWAAKSLTEVCTVTSSNRIFAEEYCEEGIPFYRGKEISELSRGENISIELFISTQRYEKLKESNNVPLINDVLITAVGTIGNIWVVDTNKPFYFKDGNIIWLKDIDSGKSNSIFFRYMLSKIIESEKNKIANGSAYKALTIQNLKKTPIYLPPLELQEKFAERVEQIERQKKAVEETIANLQTLLNSRMDYWFN